MSKLKTKKRKDSSRLTYKENNVVNFSEAEIERLFIEYRNTIETCKLINEDTLQLTSKMLKNTWFLKNCYNYINISHLNNGNESIKVHDQFQTYTLRESFRSISSHDCYKVRNLNYKNTDMGRLFSMIENGESNYIKIS